MNKILRFTPLCTISIVLYQCIEFEYNLHLKNSKCIWNFLLETLKFRVIVFYPWGLFIYILTQMAANLTFLTSRNLSQPSMIVCSWEPGSSVTSSQLSDSPSDSPRELGSPTLRAGEWWLPSAIPHYALNQTTEREKNHNVLKVIYVLGLLK